MSLGSVAKAIQGLDELQLHAHADVFRARLQLRGGKEVRIEDISLDQVKDVLEDTATGVSVLAKAVAELSDVEFHSLASVLLQNMSQQTSYLTTVEALTNEEIGVVLGKVAAVFREGRM